MIQDNISGIFGKIEAICRKIGRDPGEITLIGVTKHAGADQVNEAIAAGLTHIGENKVQEAQSKFSSLDGGRKVTKHMIGHLQTNKVKLALEIFDCIQSVDSLKLATAIEEQAAKLSKQIDILVQVNTAGEEQKFGIDPAEVQSLVDEILKCKHLRLHGLMTMAPFIDDEMIIRGCFEDLRKLYEQLNKQYSEVDLSYLSMGMTADYEIALEEGSNMVRIGRAIFSGM